jgi:hypothetical protein
LSMKAPSSDSLCKSNSCSKWWTELDWAQNIWSTTFGRRRWAAGRLAARCLAAGRLAARCLAAANFCRGGWIITLKLFGKSMYTSNHQTVHNGDIMCRTVIQRKTAVGRMDRNKSKQDQIRPEWHGWEI